MLNSSTTRLLLRCSLLAGAAFAARIRSQSRMSHAQGSEARKSLNNTRLQDPKLPVAPTVELAVKMHCESCANSVRGVLNGMIGVDEVIIDLEMQTVVVKGNARPAQLAQALRDAGRDARVVGLGSAESVVPAEIGSADEWVASVAEFKGKVYGHGDVVGVVRMVQLSSDDMLVDAEIGGLSGNSKYSVCAHEFGDLRQVPKTCGKKLAVLAEGTTNTKGDLVVVSSGASLKVWDLIGRSIVLYHEDNPLVGTVIARSAGVGANSGKRLCTCDGTVIWEAKY